MGKYCESVGGGHMHEFYQVPSLLCEPVEPVSKRTSVLQKVERVAEHRMTMKLWFAGDGGGQAPEHFPALNKQLVQHALTGG